MLANFTICRTFNKLRVTLVVDCVRKDADLALTYDRRLREQRAVPFWEVETPEKAEAYLSRPAGELGTMVETIEHQYRHKWGIAA